MKKISVVLLFIIFLIFLFYHTQRSTEFQVLKVISPTEIVVDFNKNGVEDNEELVLLENINSFSTKQFENQLELAKKIKISQEDAIGLGFLAENFAKETIEGKKIKLKKSNITIDNKDYENLMVTRGFAFYKDKTPDFQFWKNVEKARKYKLIILNNKNHKYHKLNCKYGLVAHNSQILPAFQLPKDAKPCKFCFAKEQNARGKKQKVKFDEIPNIKSPAVVFQTNYIKVFLTDMTRILKPSNSCSTEICKALLGEINRSQESIDFAIYGYTKIPEIQKALEEAQKRGVNIRFIYDLDSYNKNIYPDTLYLAKIFTNNNHDVENTIMHNKFFIFDKKTVMTGSANVSNTDMSGFNSNVVLFINSKKIADIYRQEFNQMYNGKFHKKKLKICDNLDKNVKVYFSPQDKAIATQIIPLVNNAQKYIYIPAFLITHKDLSDSLINASKRGVSVKIILDATNTHTNSSKMKILRQNGIQVKTENFAGKLHSKSIIIDDLYTLIGSMNFSRSGESLNDENLIIIKDHDISLFYKTFFQYLWQRIPDKWLKYNALSESFDSIGSCSDGIDNDFDGKIDKADEGCSYAFQLRKK